MNLEVMRMCTDVFSWRLLKSRGSVVICTLGEVVLCVWMNGKIRAGRHKYCPGRRETLNYWSIILHTFSAIEAKGFPAHLYEGTR